MANRVATAGLSRAGYSSRRAAEVKREAWWWLTSRSASAARGRQLVPGQAVAFLPGGRVQLVARDVVGAGPGQVTVRLVFTAISAGTERAQYLGLPNARVKPGHVTGYSGVGVVILRGDGSAIDVGSRVLVINCPHQSVVTVDQSRIVPIPDSVDDRTAALGHLGGIALHGVEQTRVEGKPTAVLGLGVIGALAARLLPAHGASQVMAVATSDRKLRRGRPRPDQFLLARSEELRQQAGRWERVIEATGAGDGLHTAVALGAPKARITLLGSSRAAALDLPMADICERELHLVGAHVKNAANPFDDPRTPQQRLASTFLDHLASGDLEVGDLLDLTADPREPERLFRRLAADGAVVSGVFDWSRLDGARVPGWSRRPALAGQGVDYGAAPVAAPRAGPSRPGRSGTPASQLRIALVGCGDISVLNAEAARHAQGVELTACYDPNVALARELAADHGARDYQTFEALLAADDVDAVFICVPHDLHAPLAEQAASAGKHIIVEKPPAQSLADARRIVHAADAAGVRLTVCLPSRFEPTSRAARWLLSRGAIGAPIGASVTFLTDRPPGYYHGGLSGRTHGAWRTDPVRSGGGIAIMNLTHQLDLLLDLVGQPVTDVTASTSCAESPRGIEDLATAILQFRDGGQATIQGCTSVRGTSHEGFRLWGSDGHLELAPTPQLYTIARLPGYRVGRWQRLALPPPTDPRVSFLEETVTAMTTDSELRASPMQALHLQEVIEALYRSAEDGRLWAISDLHDPPGHP